MPDETGTETTRSDAPSADDSLFGDAADDPAAAPAEEQVSNEETEQDWQDAAAASADEQGAEGGTAQDSQVVDDPQGSGDAETDAPEEGLKIVVSIKGGRATIGVQQPSSDPHIESFDGLDEAGVTQEVAAVIERARDRWEDNPRHPAYERPAPPTRRRNRRSQETAQAANTGAETEQTQQQTLRLF